MFTKAEMNIHIYKTGKKLDPRQEEYSVPNGLQKAKSFLTDEYLQDIKAASDSNFFMSNPYATTVLKRMIHLVI